MNSVKNRLEEVVGIIIQFRSLIDSHMVNFFTHNLWERNVPVGIRNEVNKVPMDEALQAFWNSESHTISPANCVEIKRYVNEIKSIYIDSFESLLNLNQLKVLMNDWGCSDHSIKLDQSFMSLKKSHEVEIMSGIIASLFKIMNCSHVVDVGGGKGYLSSVLCLEHKFKILGLDSSSSNTHVATKRTERMQKSWEGVRKRIEKGEECGRKGKNWKAKFSNINSSGNNDNHVDSGSDDSQSSNRVIYKVNINSFDQENYTIEKRNKNLLLDNNFKQATHYVSRNTRLSDIVDSCFPDDKNKRLALIGLHTCGDLGASCLRLFVDNLSNSLVDLLVNVGCCYHLLTEKYPEVPPVKHSCLTVCANSVSNADYGFPMSDYLCSKRFSLSYNSRVLSAQPVEKIAHQNKMPSEVLFYRALLEVILRRCSGPSTENSTANKDLYCVGHIKCTNFPEYVQKAINKLKLDIQVNESELIQLYKDYEKHRKELFVYFMMRVTLAPLVEAMILLDRLLYLHENGIRDAHLVKLFDPLLSPRCYGILAFRNLRANSD